MALQSKTIYDRYYGDFRGVDFSSDHTQVDSQRLAYAVNMYKDYQAGQGQALETVPGFRKRVALPEDAEVFGIHHFQIRDQWRGTLTQVLIHAGDKLYHWYNYPDSIGITHTMTVELEAPVTEDAHTYFTIQLSRNVRQIVDVEGVNGKQVTAGAWEWYPAERTLILTNVDGLREGDMIEIVYLETPIAVDAPEFEIYTGMNPVRSTSFVFNNRLYIIDGKNYLVYDGDTVQSVTECAYVPTTYINIIPAGENADIGTEYEQRNILQPKFKHTFIADGETKVFYMNENILDGIAEVKVYGVVLAEGADYAVDLAMGAVSFNVAPVRPEEAPMPGYENICYPEFYAGVEITAVKVMHSVSGVTEEREIISELVTECTVAAVFDDRVFLSGNPAYPNHVFYCGRNLTGYTDPTYFGILNYQQDGVGTVPITGMIPVADSLMVLKGDTQQDGSVYFHTPAATGEDLHTKVYPSTRGLSGIGCLGACVNFLDDPVFISRLGVEAVGQLSVRYERAIEHRSSLVDAKLVNLDLSRATLEEWNGYLVLLIDGKIFLADSRQRYTHESGVVQYEWYYLEDIGTWDRQYPAYQYATQRYTDLLDPDAPVRVRWCCQCGRDQRWCRCEADGITPSILELPLQLADRVYDSETGTYVDRTGQTVNPPNEAGENTATVHDAWVSVELDGQTYGVGVYYTVCAVTDPLSGEVTGYEAYLCEGKGDHIGGVFRPATALRTMDDNLFFGTAGGVICSFNFDMREDTGEISPRYYDFDGRIIHCGCATRMDCCDVPHLTKNTVKKSTVIKTKSYPSSAAKIKVRTNRKSYEQIARINSSLFSWDNVDFTDFSFNTTEQSLFAVKERERRWVEKQYYVYSDEYRKPFALYYISYRYCIAGRFKE